jgi:hypothetical protein
MTIKGLLLLYIRIITQFMLWHANVHVMNVHTFDEIFSRYETNFLLNYYIWSMNAYDFDDIIIVCYHY